jgi:hypothetical protein
LDKGVTTIEVAVVVVVLTVLVVVPFTHEASYPVMAEPPLDVGAVNFTVALPAAAVTETRLGAPGTVAAATGVTLATEEVTLVEVLLLAVTVQEYSLPLVRPVTAIGLIVPVTVFLVVSVVPTRQLAV